MTPEEKGTTVSMLVLDAVEQTLYALGRRVNECFYRETKRLDEEESNDVIAIQNLSQSPRAAEGMGSAHEMQARAMRRREQLENIQTNMLQLSHIVQQANRLQRRHVPRQPPLHPGALLIRLGFNREMDNYIRTIKRNAAYKDAVPALQAMWTLAQQKDLTEFETSAFDPKIHTKERLSRNSDPTPIVSEHMSQGGISETALCKNAHYNDLAEGYLIKANLGAKKAPG